MLGTKLVHLNNKLHLFTLFYKKIENMKKEENKTMRKYFLVKFNLKSSSWVMLLYKMGFSKRYYQIHIHLYIITKCINITKLALKYTYKEIDIVFFIHFIH